MKSNKTACNLSGLFLFLLLMSIIVLLQAKSTVSKYVISQMYSVNASTSDHFDLVSIGAIKGSMQVGEKLNSGDLSPGGATVSFQWQRSVDNSIFSNIPNAISSDYTLTQDDLGCFIRVICEGTGAFRGNAVSVSAGPVCAIPLISVSASGETQLGMTVTASALPECSDAKYTWLRSSAANGSYVSTGLTGNTYTLSGADLNSYIKVKAEGLGSYSGTVWSSSIGPITPGILTAIGPIKGTIATNQIISAGDLTPAGATVTYQWMRSKNNGPYMNIDNAVKDTYTISNNDYGCRFKVTAKGSGNYTGTVSSDATEAVSKYGLIAATTNGSAVYGNILKFNSVNPSAASQYINYQWQSSSDNTTFENITGATSDSYKLTTAEVGKYVRLAVIGYGSYSGTVYSTANQVSAKSILSVSVNGTPQFGQTLTAVLNPTDATATYKWLKCHTNYGTFFDTGVNTDSYTLGAGDINYYFKVVVTGYGGYKGTISSSCTSSAVSYATIESIGNITGNKMKGSVLTAGEIVPSGAAVTYQWQKVWLLNIDWLYNDISGATSSTYTLTNRDVGGYYIRLVVTGNPDYGYIGQVVSDPIYIP